MHFHPDTKNDDGLVSFHERTLEYAGISGLVGAGEFYFLGVCIQKKKNLDRKK